ncbi:hypothetical protein Fmac_010114 [Flemingia macrophylla]|uniref:Uncharacterized protein n=1 Tax=Flemingia macrophylla TaxID=520843 RepID=A0ABD1N281_9FABA
MLTSSLHLPFLISLHLRRHCACESTPLMDFRGKLTVNPMNSVSNRKFLIDFIITSYLGPDVKFHSPCSAIQRLMTESPPYTSSDLGPSYVSISFLERLYYYLLRNAPSNLVLDLNMFYLYLKGRLILPGTDFTQDTVQFTSFFPFDLHRQIWYPDNFKVIKGIVLIDDPFTSCMKREDLNRFMSLTGVSTLKLNLSECIGFQLGCPCLNRMIDLNKLLNRNKRLENIPNGGWQSSKYQQEHKRKYVDDTLPPATNFPNVLPTKHNAEVGPSGNTYKPKRPTLMPLLSLPDFVNSSFILKGTAKKGLIGPSVGVVDIGIGKKAYLFRASLPGVYRDDNQFSCDVESDGRVQIKGVLTGGRTIMKHSRIFQMLTQRLCPSGPFTLSFSLPGPVDPRLFTPLFRTDGIFEGVIIKH